MYSKVNVVPALEFHGLERSRGKCPHERTAGSSIKNSFSSFNHYLGILYWGSQSVGNHRHDHVITYTGGSFRLTQYIHFTTSAPISIVGSFLLQPCLRHTLLSLFY